MGIFSDANKKPSNKPKFGQRPNNGNFGKKKKTISKRSKKFSDEKNTLSNNYYKYLHNSNQKCVICGSNIVEIHHITDLKKLPNLPRRSWNRVVTLCPDHHRLGLKAIHKLSKDEFYTKVMSFEKLMEASNNLYQNYLKE